MADRTDHLTRSSAEQLAEVTTIADLTAAIDRLRRLRATEVGEPRLGLDRLARLTGIPRSTLHNYLAGDVLIPANALDRLVQALGVRGPGLRAWSEALERVTRTARGTGLASATRAAEILAVDARIRAALTRPTDGWYDQTQEISVSERVIVGAERAIVSVQRRVTVRALTGGVDRCSLRMWPRAGIDLDALEAGGLRNCMPGRHRTLTDPPVRVLELLFDHPLSAGETYPYEVTVDFAEARTGELRPSVEAGCIFKRRGPAYTLEVSFGDDLPRRIRQVHQDFVDGPEQPIADLTPNAWGSVHFFVERPGAGVHAIRWEWPEPAGDQQSG
ncbi:helix-turn-helix transcriptional regulator [Flexivirga sp. ID2601S]|uniref:Helix-turn-helix transcriptional regulator n=1 Tax=Flexivirga aerilata TaxID=1656889 RepID=A0A849ALH9_9MICO|nr:helix-turn-helix transcriptional regulator [Flexivirga aerilata]NNG40647.1 helix-turn-helix transcriptional regulator [Flexivirga aerilata]